MAALAFSASGHGRLQNKSGHVPPADARRMKKTHVNKTHERRKKTCDSHRLEEDPAEEDPLFKPADLLHFQNGVDRGHSLASRCCIKARSFMPQNQAHPVLA